MFVRLPGKVCQAAKICQTDGFVLHLLSEPNTSHADSDSKYVPHKAEGMYIILCQQRKYLS